jgi:hypothetical protein
MTLEGTWLGLSEQIHIGPSHSDLAYADNTPTKLVFLVYVVYRVKRRHPEVCGED